jgi:hypothetical protein
LSSSIYPLCPKFDDGVNTSAPVGREERHRTVLTNAFVKGAEAHGEEAMREVLRSVDPRTRPHQLGQH